MIINGLSYKEYQERIKANAECTTRLEDTKDLQMNKYTTKSFNSSTNEYISLNEDIEIEFSPMMQRAKRLNNEQ